MAKNRLRLFGGGVRSRTISDLIRWQFQNAFEIEGAYDDAKQRGSVVEGGLTILGNVQDGLEHAEKDSSCFFLVAFGTRTRFRACELFMKLMRIQARIATLIAPGAIVSPSARVGLNAMVMPGVFLGHDVKVGHLCFIHGGAAIEHDSQLGNDVMVAPGVKIAGFVSVGDHCFLGVGTSVAPELSIGPGTVIGAGSLVLKSQPSHAVAYGFPARRVRSTSHDDEVLSRSERRELTLQGWQQLCTGRGGTK